MVVVVLVVDTVGVLELVLSTLTGVVLPVDVV